MFQKHYSGKWMQYVLKGQVQTYLEKCTTAMPDEDGMKGSTAGEVKTERQHWIKRRYKFGNITWIDLNYKEKKKSSILKSNFIMSYRHSLRFLQHHLQQNRVTGSQSIPRLFLFSKLGGNLLSFPFQLTWSHVGAKIMWYSSLQPQSLLACSRPKINIYICCRITLMIIYYK